MTKERISATIDKETIKKIDKIFEGGQFRNKSHLIEEVIKFYDEKNGKDEK